MFKVKMIAGLLYAGFACGTRAAKTCCNCEALAKVPTGWVHRYVNTRYFQKREDGPRIFNDSDLESLSGDRMKTTVALGLLRFFVREKVLKLFPEGKLICSDCFACLTTFLSHEIHETCVFLQLTLAVGDDSYRRAIRRLQKNRDDIKCVVPANWENHNSQAKKAQKIQTAIQYADILNSFLTTYGDKLGKAHLKKMFKDLSETHVFPSEKSAAEHDHNDYRKKTAAIERLSQMNSIELSSEEESELKRLQQEVKAEEGQ